MIVLHTFFSGYSICVESSFFCFVLHHNSRSMNDSGNNDDDDDHENAKEPLLNWFCTYNSHSAMQKSWRCRQRFFFVSSSSCRLIIQIFFGLNFSRQRTDQMQVNNFIHEGSFFFFFLLFLISKVAGEGESDYILCVFLLLLEMLIDKWTEYFADINLCILCTLMYRHCHHKSSNLTFKLWVAMREQSHKQKQTNMNIQFFTFDPMELSIIITYLNNFFATFSMCLAAILHTPTRRTIALVRKMLFTLLLFRQPITKSRWMNKILTGPEWKRIYNVNVDTRIQAHIHVQEQAHTRIHNEKRTWET